MNLSTTAQKSNPLHFRNSAFYYLMKNGFILRLEEPMDLQNIPLLIQANLYDKNDVQVLNQEQIIESLFLEMKS